ncbi:MAG: hypothetical protein CMK74_05700 [Pseudomonadales bacterium]|nr:hypothetical protein [Pseudomonadales bacterium]|tara:strand:+ start:1043 stop:2107 length:1065 start_codon:yes stop_codon:yes gene_type:complete
MRKLRSAVTVNEMLSDNIGDQAICLALKRLLEENKIHPILADFSGRKAITQNQFKKDQRKAFFSIPSRIRQVARGLKTLPYIIRQSRGPEEAYIIGGGQLILGNSNFPFLMFLWVKILKLYKKKVYLVGVGASGDLSLIDRTLYKSALKKTDAIYVRDQKSLNNLAKLGLTADVTPDIAYYLHEDSLPSVSSVRDNKFSVICPTDYSIYKRYESESNLPKNLTLKDYTSQWLGIVNQALISNDKIILTATTKEDLDFTKEIHNQTSATDKTRIEFVNRLPDPTSFMEICKGADTTVSGRMHALILAHLAGSKLLPYEISKKIITYSNEYSGQSPKELKSKIIKSGFIEKIKEKK